MPATHSRNGGVLIGSDYDTARTRKMNADAEIAELELALRRKEVTKTDDVVRAWGTVLHAARTKFLSTPTKLAPVLAPITDPAVIKDYLERAIREALEEMANYQPQIDPTVVSALVDATASTDGEEKPKRRVGRPRKVERLR